MLSGKMLDPESAPANSAILPVQLEDVAYRPTAVALDRWHPRLLAAQFLVSLYRLISLAVLSSILLGLACYLVLTVFYFFSRSWMEPRIISPTDEHVLLLNNQLAQ